MSFVQVGPAIDTLIVFTAMWVRTCSPITACAILFASRRAVRCSRTSFPRCIILGKHRLYLLRLRCRATPIQSKCDAPLSVRGATRMVWCPI